MYCGGGAGEDRERVVITHPPVTRNEQALRSKFLVTAKGWYLQAFYFDFVKVFINFCCQPLSYDSGC